jgi:hypothetical protein
MGRQILPPGRKDGVSGGRQAIRQIVKILKLLYIF